MNIKKTLFRIKEIDLNETNELKNCLNLFSLTLLGIGSTLGLGVYVLIGEVASKAGPAILISFIVATVASFFSSLCYAEFGAKIPKAGSAYVYSYVSVGEFIAFIIGWNLVLEYAIGTSSVAKGYSLYLDSLFQNRLSKFFQHYLPINLGPRFSNYFDLLSFLITISLTILLCIGIKKTSNFNSVFTCLNILIVIFVFITGSFNIDFHNWSLSENEVGPNGGKGGFFPFGIEGILKASSTCFFFFVGFDCICTSSQETKNPKKAIPLAIIFCLITVSFAYIGISSIQTLIWPYYDPKFLPEIFEKKGLYVIKWIITVGTLTGLSSSLLGSIFPLPRILYSMACDGLIYRFFSKINQRTKIPLQATIISGFFTAFISSIFNLKELADMMSIGTLLAYTLVAISVLILRYNDESEQTSLSLETYDFMYMYSFNNLFNLERLSLPTNKTSYISCRLIAILIVFTNLLCCYLMYEMNYLYSLSFKTYFNISLIVIFIIFFSICLYNQPQNTNLYFQVPFVPFIPLISIFFNTLLLLNLSSQTWIRFVFWMIIGFFIYFTYGIKNSSGYMNNEEKSAFLNSKNIKNTNLISHDNISFVS